MCCRFVEQGLQFMYTVHFGYPQCCSQVHSKGQKEELQSFLERWTWWPTWTSERCQRFQGADGKRSLSRQGSQAWRTKKHFWVEENKSSTGKLAWQNCITEFWERHNQVMAAYQKPDWWQPQTKETDYPLLWRRKLRNRERSSKCFY